MATPAQILQKKKAPEKKDDKKSDNDKDDKKKPTRDAMLDWIAGAKKKTGPRQ